MSPELAGLLGLLLVFLLPAIAVGLAVVLFRAPLERGIARLVARLLHGRGSGTIAFSFGTRAEEEPGGVIDLDALPARGGARSLEPSRRAHYRDAWKRAEALFPQAPDTAVREAQRLVGDLMRELGIPAARLGHVATLRMGSQPGFEHVGAAVEVFRSVRSAARGIDQAARYRESDPEDLRSAMNLYARVLGNLLQDESPGPPA